MTVFPAETARHLRAPAAERLERIEARGKLARALAERAAAWPARVVAEGVRLA